MSGLKVGDWVKLINEEVIQQAEQIWKSRNLGGEFTETEVTGVVIRLDDEIIFFLPSLGAQMQVPVEADNMLLTKTEPPQVLQELWARVKDRVLAKQAYVQARIKELQENRDASTEVRDEHGTVVRREFEIQPPDNPTQGFDDGSALYDDGLDEVEDDVVSGEIDAFVQQPEQVLSKPPKTDPTRPAVVTDAMRMLAMLHGMRLSCTNVAYQMYLQKCSREDSNSGGDDTRALQVRLTKPEEELRDQAADVVRRYLKINAATDDDLRLS